MNEELIIQTRGQGLIEITGKLVSLVNVMACQQGLCTVFVTHTSASLTIQENADPSARRDLENWLNRLVPEKDDIYTHTTEGPDDMPAHVKVSMIGNSLSIPITNRHLALGTWQGIYLCEHRNHGGRRRVVLTLWGE